MHTRMSLQAFVLAVHDRQMLWLVEMREALYPDHHSRFEWYRREWSGAVRGR